MYKSQSKKSRRSRCAAPINDVFRIEVRSTEAFLFNWGNASKIEVHITKSRRKAPWIKVHSTEAFNLNWAGIEVRSTESRCEAPWIEVHSTEAFNLNWGDAQTWLGQLLVHNMAHSSNSGSLLRVGL